MPIIMLLYSKSSVSKCFSSTRKQKPGVFKYLRLEERFRNVPISVDGKRDRKKLSCVFKFLRLQDTLFLHNNHSSRPHHMAILFNIDQLSQWAPGQPC